MTAIFNVLIICAVLAVSLLCACLAGVSRLDRAREEAADALDWHATDREQAVVEALAVAQDELHAGEAVLLASMLRHPSGGRPGEDHCPHDPTGLRLWWDCPECCYWNATVRAIAYRATEGAA